MKFLIALCILLIAQPAIALQNSSQGGPTNTSPPNSNSTQGEPTDTSDTSPPMWNTTIARNYTHNGTRGGPTDTSDTSPPMWNTTIARNYTHNGTQGDVHAYMPVITCQAIQEAYKKQQCCTNPDADFQLAPTAGNSTSYTFTCQAIKEAYKNQQCCTKPYANFQLPAAGTRRAKEPKGTGADWVQKLETLSVLHKQGLMTNQEFQAAKMRLVDTIVG